MDMTLESCRSFTSALASSAPAPGGGGAAAMVGAIGTALGGMVAALTVGKKKYAAVETEMQGIQRRCTELQTQLLNQVEADEIGFLPLARAYSIPKNDPNRADLLEEATRMACDVPLKIMALCCDAIDCIAFLAENGSRLSVSDAGCAAVICKAALQAASLNVFANTKSMQNRAAAEELNRQTNLMLNKYGPLAEALFASVREIYA